MLPKQTPVIFFDAECRLCFNSIHYLKRFDRKKKLLFSPLKGNLAAELEKEVGILKQLNAYGLPSFKSLQSVIFLHHGTVFVRGKQEFFFSIKSFK